MIRLIVVLISITSLLAEKYLIETSDREGEQQGDIRGEEEGGEGGSDYSFPLKLKMEQSGR